MRKAWAVLWVTYLASVVIVINQFKVPPVMNILLNELGIDMIVGGWLMSVFAVAGIILSLPAALVLDRLGARLSGILALVFTGLGSVLGALAPNATILLMGRVVEGIGLGLIAVVAPAVIAMWFPPEKRGLPMGIWASWVPLGSFIIFNCANPIVGLFSWRGVWWFGTLVSLIALVAYALVVPKNPDVSSLGDGANPTARVSFSLGLKSPAIWFLALAFGGFGFANGAFVTWAPQYFNQVHQVLPDLANFYTSIPAMASILATVLAGWVLTHVRSKTRILILSAILTCVLYGYSLQLPTVGWIIPWMILMGFLPGFFPTTIFTLAPEAVPTPQLAGLAMAIVNLVFNTGFFLGPPLLGRIVTQYSWEAGTIPLVGALILSILSCLIFIRFYNRSKIKS